MTRPSTSGAYTPFQATDTDVGFAGRGEAIPKQVAPIEHWAYQVDTPFRPLHEIVEMPSLGHVGQPVQQQESDELTSPDLRGPAWATSSIGLTELGEENSELKSEEGEDELEALDKEVEEEQARHNFREPGRETEFATGDMAAMEDEYEFGEFARENTQTEGSLAEPEFELVELEPESEYLSDYAGEPDTDLEVQPSKLQLDFASASAIRVEPLLESKDDGTYVVRHPYWPENIVKPAVVKIDTAVRRNRQYAGELGWAKNRAEIVELLTRILKWPAISDERAFAMALAQWQMRQGLTVDGQLGPKTWRRMRVLLCRAYEPGEKERSRTSKGNLDQDVRLFKGRLLIADFAEGSSEVKSATRREPLLKEWLDRFERNNSYRLNVMGFTDCVGDENENEKLRRARASAVFQLLGPSTRSRVDFVGSGDIRRHVSNNLTPATRAMNRSVLIEFKRDMEYEPERVTGKRPSVEDAVTNCRRVLTRQKEIGIELGDKETKRILCWLGKVLDPKVDDRYVPNAKWEAGDYYLHASIEPTFFERTFISHLRDQVRALQATEREATVLSLLAGWDVQIVRSIVKAHRLESPMGGGSAVPVGSKQIHDWIARQGRDRNSIYSCYN